MQCISIDRRMQEFHKEGQVMQKKIDICLQNLQLITGVKLIV